MITVNYRYPITGVTDFSAQLFLEGVAVGAPVVMAALVINSQPSGYTADFVGVNDGDADEVQVSSVSQGFGEPLSLSQAAVVDLSGIATAQNVTDSTTTITDALDNLPEPTVDFTGIATITKQEGILSAIGNIDAGGGSGAYSVTVTITDGTNSLENATVRLSEGANSFSVKTDASGIATFALDAATYNIAVTKSGYQVTPTTIVVDAAHSAFTVAMAAVTIPAPAHAGTSIIYVDTRTESGEVDGIKVTATLVEDAPVLVSGAYECSFTITKKSGEYDDEFPGETPVSGRVKFYCYPGMKYKLRGDFGLRKTVQAPAEGTAENIADLVQV